MAAGLKNLMTKTKKKLGLAESTSIIEETHEMGSMPLKPAPKGLEFEQNQKPMNEPLEEVSIPSRINKAVDFDSVMNRAKSLITEIQEEKEREVPPGPIIPKTLVSTKSPEFANTSDKMSVNVVHVNNEEEIDDVVATNLDYIEDENYYQMNNHRKSITTTNNYDEDDFPDEIDEDEEGNPYYLETEINSTMIETTEEQHYEEELDLEDAKFLEMLEHDPLADTSVLKGQTELIKRSSIRVIYDEEETIKKTTYHFEMTLEKLNDLYFLEVDTIGYFTGTDITGKVVQINPLKCYTVELF